MGKCKEGTGWGTWKEGTGLGSILRGPDSEMYEKDQMCKVKRGPIGKIKKGTRKENVTNGLDIEM